MGPATEKEKDLLADYFITEKLIEQLESDRLLFPTLPFKIPEVYVNYIDKTLIELRKEQSEKRQFMKKENMKIYPSHQDDIMIHVPYNVRGYNSYFRFWNAALRNFINKKVTNVMGIK